MTANCKLRFAISRNKFQETNRFINCETVPIFFRNYCRARKMGVLLEAYPGYSKTISNIVSQMFRRIYP